MKLGGLNFNSDLSSVRYGLLNSLFDQIITFRLAELKEAWGAIYRAEKAIEEARKKRDVTKAAAMLAEAKALATRVPVPEAKANDMEFNKAFKGKEKGEARARFAMSSMWPFTEEGGFSLAHFVNFFERSLFMESFLNSLTAGVMAVIFGGLISLPPAFFTIKYDFKGRTLIQMLGAPLAYLRVRTTGVEDKAGYVIWVIMVALSPLPLWGAMKFLSLSEYAMVQ